jgi:tRNA(adenine34) deaminase
MPTAKKSPAKKSAGNKTARTNKHRWVAKVNTVSTYPEDGLFTKDAATIANHLASRKVSPKGPASGMRMLTYFINRGGKGLSKSRLAELEKAKKLLHEKVVAARKKAA